MQTLREGGGDQGGDGEGKTGGLAQRWRGGAEKRTGVRKKRTS